MKLNISYPATGCQKVLEIDDEKKLHAFYDKRMSQEVDGSVLGDDFKGYIFRISGGNDKEGFAMKQGILTSQRVRILFSKGHSCFRERRSGERKRKSTRGCIVSAALSVLNLVVVKKGDNEIPGLTDQIKPRRLGPKRASRIRKLFNLTKEDDVRKYVIRRQIVKGDKKPVTKAPKIQRLVTPLRLQHRRQLLAEKRQRYEKSQQAAKEYNEMLSKYLKEQRDQKLSKKRSLSRRESGKEETKAAPAKAKEQPKVETKAKDQGKKTTPAAAPAPAAKAEKKAAPAPAKQDTPKDQPKKAEAKAEKKEKAAPAPAAAKKDQPKEAAKDAAAKKGKGKDKQ